MMKQTIQLDHVVLLLPYKDVTHPPAWITDNFIVSPGGVHADGKTENRLILFQDGTYLELIAFVDDDLDKRHGHWWDKNFGVVDFAFTTPEPFDFDSLQERLQKSKSGIEYAPPQAGGRARPDGVELKWEVTFPKGAQRGEVPFWCHDITPRDRRVPITEENTTHPSGALGMGGAHLQVNGGDVERLTSAMAAITNNERACLSAPNAIGELRKPSIRVAKAEAEAGHALSLALQTNGKQSPRDIQHRIGDGLVSILFE